MTAWKKIVAWALAGAGFFGCVDQPKAVKIPPTGIASDGFKSHWEKSDARTAADKKGTGGKEDGTGGAPSSAQAKTLGGQDDGSVLTSGLHVSDEIVRACNLPADAYAPKFEFDSASIGQDDRDVLATIAKCLCDGALRGRHVTLVGRADARGEQEYNMSLGESRADSVLRYLNNLGVARDRVKASSRGELDATGRDEATYAMDRRVDIELVN